MLQNSCKLTPGLLEQIYRRPGKNPQTTPLFSLLQLIFGEVTIQQNVDYRPERGSDTIGPERPGEQKAVRRNALHGQKHYSMAVLLPFLGEQ